MNLPRVIDENDVVIIDIPEALSVVNVNGVSELWNEHIRHHPRLIALRCSNLTHIDSMGIACLVRFLHSADSNAVPFMLVDVSDSVRAIMQVAEVDRLFTLGTEAELQRRSAIIA